MSETDKDQKTRHTEEENVSVEAISAAENTPDENVAAQESAPVEDATAEHSAFAQEVAVDEKPGSRSGTVLVWLSLLLSVVALTAVGYREARDWLAAGETETDDAIRRLDSRLSAAQEDVSALDARVGELGVQDDSTIAGLDAVKTELDQRVRPLSSLPGRMSTLEGSVSSLVGVSKGARDTWLLAEAEYYLQIANAQLQLANNPHLATLALGMADERIVQMSNPALTDVRRAIADELASLDVMDKPDIAGATMTLASLARVVESLPFRGTAEDSGKDEQAAEEEPGGMSRAWSSMKGAFSGLVKVTPPDQAKLALLSPDAEYFLRNNLALQLQSARLALLRGERAVFEQTLDDTSALMTQYFDEESAQVVSAQETLAEIRGNVFTTSVPDISESLRLLRQFRSLRENVQ